MGSTASRTAPEEVDPKEDLTGKPGRRAYTRALYDALVTGYRLAPGNAAHAARVAGCERRCALRAWSKGWKGLPWARPIQTVLAEETQAARARAADIEKRKREADDARREAARQEQVEAEAQERTMLKAARQDVLSAAVVCAELVPTMRALGRIVAEAAGIDPATGKPSGNKPTVDAKAAMMMLSRWTGMAGKVVYASEVLVQLGRTERGQPNAIVGHVQEDMSPEQTEEELLAGVELLARMRGLDPMRVQGFLRDLAGQQGGKSLDVPALPPAGSYVHSLGEETNGTY